jgi:glycosyltransferase involved in cell wall biosynthesis
VKVLWVGDACVATGFARVTHAACDELVRRGHEVDVLGINYMGDPHDRPYRVWPCRQPHDEGHDLMGVTRLPVLMARLVPDVVVLLQDPWNIASYFRQIDGFAEGARTVSPEMADRVLATPVIGHMAVDGKNQRGGDLDRLAHVITWTRFGAEELASGGYSGESTIVPLGVDLDRFTPIDRVEARSRVLPEAIGPDAFVVGAIGRNQPRKRLDLTIAYFADWVNRRNVDDAYLALHVAPTGEAGADVRSLISYYGLSGRVVVSKPPIGAGAPDDLMPHVLSALDVYLTTTQGEGWGLPALEAMACGVPVVAPRWSGLGDWARDAAVLVPCTATALTAPTNAGAGPHTIGGVVDRIATIEALDDLYRSPLHRRTIQQRGLRLAAALPWERTARETADVVERVVDVDRAASAAQDHPVAAPGSPQGTSGPDAQMNPQPLGDRASEADVEPRAEAV